MSWAGSFSRDAGPARLPGTHADGDPGWAARRARVVALLAEADRLAALADLVGAGSLPGHERMVLLGGRLLREGVLQQSALSAARRLLLRRRRPRRWWTLVLARGRPLRGARRRRNARGHRRGAGLRAGPARPRGGRPRRRRRRGAVRGTRCWPAWRRRERAAAVVEYSDVREVRGPLLVVRGVTGSAGTSSPTIRLDDRRGAARPRPGGRRRPRGGAGARGHRRDARPHGTGVAFAGQPLRIPVGDGWLGRVCNGRGEPLDGGPAGPRRPAPRRSPGPRSTRSGANRPPSRCSPASPRSTR